jgi:hypothetical protein
MSISIQQLNEYTEKYGEFKVYGESAGQLLFNGVNALNRLNLWHWIKCFDPNRGFCNSNNQYTIEIANALVTDGHTGVTFSLLLRTLQRISQLYIQDDGQNLVCSICGCDKYISGTKTILECGHMFHYVCINTWKGTVLANGRCPNCRKYTLPDYN